MEGNRMHDAALNAAWNQVTPYSQIKTDGFNPEPGQFDLTVKTLSPLTAENGMYAIKGEFTIDAPTTSHVKTYTRTLYVGTKKDNMAQLPETRLNSPGLRFLKAVAAANKVSTNDQSDAALCKAITGKKFGCRIEETSYTDRNGNEKKGSDFGRNVTPVGTVPARLDREAAQPRVNGQAGPVVTPTANVPAGAFAAE